ncbi:MAG: hypothetical protein J6V44_09580 [Methanobrevibacter sp.]|nr:hypothetical protein [Methanobrevibacter sp.]
MEEGHWLLIEEFLERTYEDYRYLCKGKLPPNYPHYIREDPDKWVPLEKEKIERMAYNGVCDFLFIDVKYFNGMLRKIRREVADGKDE